MSEPSLEPPLVLPHEFYSGHAPTLRLLAIRISINANRYLHMVDKPCTELPNPEAAVLPALVSVFDSEVTLLGHFIHSA